MVATGGLATSWLGSCWTEKMVDCPYFATWFAAIASVADLLPEKAQAQSQTEIVELPVAEVLVWAVAAAVAGLAAAALALQIEVDLERLRWIDAVEPAMLVS